MGVEYDPSSHTHAWKFSQESIDVQFSSKDIFHTCNIFPEEFSLFIVFKCNVSYTKSQTVIRIRRRRRTIFSVTFTKKFIVVTYENRKVKFRYSVFTKTEWQTLAIGITGTDVILTRNCHHRKQRKLKRLFPANIPLHNATFHIGSSRPDKNIFGVCPFIHLYSDIHVGYTKQ